MNELILVSGGINWTWYLHCTIEGTTVTVLKEYRLHDFDERQGAGQHPKETHGDYRVLENTLDESRVVGRIAHSIRINDKTYKLAKPCPRFDLGKGD